MVVGQTSVSFVGKFYAKERKKERKTQKHRQQAWELMRIITKLLQFRSIQDPHAQANSAFPSHGAMQQSPSSPPRFMDSLALFLR